MSVIDASENVQYRWEISQLKDSNWSSQKWHLEQPAAKDSKRVVEKSYERNKDEVHAIKVKTGLTSPQANEWQKADHARI